MEPQASAVEDEYRQNQREWLSSAVHRVPYHLDDELVISAMIQGTAAVRVLGRVGFDTCSIEFQARGAPVVNCGYSMYYNHPLRIVASIDDAVPLLVRIRDELVAGTGRFTAGADRLTFWSADKNLQERLAAKYPHLQGQFVEVFLAKNTHHRARFLLADLLGAITVLLVVAAAIPYRKFLEDEWYNWSYWDGGDFRDISDEEYCRKVDIDSIVDCNH